MNISYLWVALGGAIGASCRVGLSSVLPESFLNIPLKILCVNILGCFAIGVLTSIMTFYWNAPLSMKHFLIQGFLGGFTTFSAFVLECGLLYEQKLYTAFIALALLSVVLSLCFFFLGLKIVK